METKIRKVGNSLGVTIPKQIIDELHVKEGDTMEIKTEGDALRLEPSDKEFEEWAEAYREANRDYKDVLKELAK